VPPLLPPTPPYGLYPGISGYDGTTSASSMITSKRGSKSREGGGGRGGGGYCDEKGRFVENPYVDDDGHYIECYYDEYGTYIRGYYNNVGKWVSLDYYYPNGKNPYKTNGSDNDSSQRREGKDKNDSGYLVFIIFFFFFYDIFFNIYFIFIYLLLFRVLDLYKLPPQKKTIYSLQKLHKIPEP
jgi:hypothetical protein